LFNPKYHPNSLGRHPAKDRTADSRFFNRLIRPKDKRLPSYDTFHTYNIWIIWAFSVS
jgi:hypothetical protein